MSRSDSKSDPLARWATWREIAAQPGIWRGWGASFDAAAARAWIAAQGAGEIWLCGAGSSAYLGEIVAAGLEGQAGPRLRAVATTDIVSRPRAFLAGRRPLVVSFGRSGDSAETLGTLDALDALAPEAPRLNITCNPKGALARRPAPGPRRVILLPEATHDAGFAMTSSFTTMLLTALAVLDAAAPPARLPARMAALAGRLEALLPALRQSAGARPGRAVFLGAGALAGAAREAALKVLELTAGATPALWETTLGFRHGPKSFVEGDTAITLFRAPDAHAARYDDDLLSELAAQFPAARLTVLGPGAQGAAEAAARAGPGQARIAAIEAPMPDGAAWGAPLAVALAQVQGVLWSEALGLDVDDPFAGRGTLSRVVSGVRLHPVAP